MLLDRAFDVSVAPVSMADSTMETNFDVAQFLYREASLLDERRFDEWLALWTQDSRYWIPRHHEQTNPFEQISLFWEDRMLRETRVRRLTNDRNWSQQPVTRSCRVVGNVCIVGKDAEDHLLVTSRLHVADYRLELRHLVGRVTHKLAKAEDGSWRIRMKRVDLVNCDSVFNNIEVFP